MRRSAAWFVVPLVLVAAACGNSSSGDSPSTTGTTKIGTDKISAVTVSGDIGAKPKVEFEPPLSFPATESKIVQAGPGTGDALSADSLVTMNYIGLNGRNADEIDSSWGTGSNAKSTPATFTLSQALKGFTTGLVGKHAGDRVLFTVAAMDAFDPNGNGTTILPGDSLVFVVDVENVATPLEQATGRSQTAPNTVPELVLKNGQPSKFTKTATTLAKPTELGVYPIIVGNGPKVESGQTITVEYVGQLYPDGKVFDESWSNPSVVSFGIGTGNVIKGWDQGLIGQPVGSRVILVIPSDLGSGKTGSGETIPPDSDLIFVVDILAAY